MTYKQWCDFRELLNILHIEVKTWEEDNE